MLNKKRHDPSKKQAIFSPPGWLAWKIEISWWTEIPGGLLKQVSRSELKILFCDPWLTVKCYYPNQDILSLNADVPPYFSIRTWNCNYTWPNFCFLSDSCSLSLVRLFHLVFRMDGALIVSSFLHYNQDRFFKYFRFSYFRSWTTILKINAEIDFLFFFPHFSPLSRHSRYCGKAGEGRKVERKEGKCSNLSPSRRLKVQGTYLPTRHARL